MPESKRKKQGSPPRPPKHTCIVHRMKPLTWHPCTGGEKGRPCKVIATYAGGRNSEKITFSHIGMHVHSRPPLNKPSPASLKLLHKRVTGNPALLPSKLRMGTDAHKPVSKLDEALYNTHRVAYHRRKILSESQGPPSIKGSIAAIMTLSQDLPEKFFEINMGDPGKGLRPVIHMQSTFMKSVLNNGQAFGSFQSDTIEGVICIIDHLKGAIDIHFTSAFDPVLARWVPVLMTIMFGCSGVDYKGHWGVLLQSFLADNWEKFQDTFPGITVDWSEAERKGHVDAFVEHVDTKFKRPLFTEADAYKFLRKCDVHFKRSRQRILQNDRVIPPKKKDDFRRLTDRLILDGTSSSDFQKTVLQLQKLFPLALPWLKWHLHPIRAKSYFPACVTNIKRFDKMSKTTNAQENLGGQFQLIFGKFMTLNAAVLNLWKFVNRFEHDHNTSLKGLSNRYSHFPLAVNKVNKKKKRKWHVNDGRGPDTNKRLRKTAKNKKLFKADLSDTLKELFANQSDSKFRGIQWNFQCDGRCFTNTCPLDSFLVLLYLLHRGRVMIHPLAELTDSSSLLARAFKELDNNDPATGGVCSRMIFMNEHYKEEWLDSTSDDLHSSLDAFFNSRSNTSKSPESKVSPILNSVVWRYNWQSPSCTLGTSCQYPAGPRKSEYDSKTKLCVKFKPMNYRVSQGMTVKVMKRIIDEKFNPEVAQESVCTVEYVPTGKTMEDGKPKETSEVICDGLLKRQRALIEESPHLAVIDFGESKWRVGTQLYDLPFQFVHLGRRWILRGAILGDGGHFTAVTRFPRC